MCHCAHYARVCQFPCSQNYENGTSLHRICPKLLTRVPDVCPSTDAENIDSSPSRIEYQASIRQPMLKLLGSSPSRLESQTSVRRPRLKLFGLSPSRLSFDWRRNCWLTSQPSVLRPLQPLMTHGLDVCLPTVIEIIMSPFVCTAQN